MNSGTGIATNVATLGLTSYSIYKLTALFILCSGGDFVRKPWQRYPSSAMVTIKVD